MAYNSFENIQQTTNTRKDKMNTNIGENISSFAIVGTGVGDFAIIILAVLISLVSTAWVAGIFGNRFSQRRQLGLLLQAASTLPIVEDAYLALKSLEDMNNYNGATFDWNSKFIMASSEIEGRIRKGLIIGSDGHHLAIHSLRQEIDRPPHEQSLHISSRIIKESGLSDLDDREVLIWLMSVVQVFISIKRENMEMATDREVGDPWLVMFGRRLSRLKTLLEACPSVLRDLAC